jgi:hypothetical protein
MTSRCSLDLSVRGAKQIVGAVFHRNYLFHAQNTLPSGLDCGSSAAG